MLNLHRAAIAKFILPNTIGVVMLDGEYQADLSQQCDGLILTKQNLQILPNIKLLKPVQLLFLYTKNCQQRVTLNIGSNSNCIIMEEHLVLTTQTCDLAIEIVLELADNSTATYYKILKQEGLAANLKARTVVRQHKNSQVHYGFMGKGVAWSSDLLQIHLLEERASFKALGAMILAKSEQLSIKFVIEHVAPHCSSNVLFKGVVADQAIGEFTGKVVVHPGADHAETHVVNKNLLLSSAATMNTEPSLEIYTDEVNCTHGATVGQLDQAALFYLRCRGIAYAQAQELLTTAFTQEILEKFQEYLRPQNLQDGCSYA